MKAIDAALLRRFVRLAVGRLAGDWVIVGGSVLPLLGIERRPTYDIDVAGPEDAGNRELLEVFAIASELGLPVEAVNPTAAFFLHRVPGWRAELVEVAGGRAGRVLRPNATLFVTMKAQRLTPVDLDDCTVMLELARARGEALDRHRIARAIEVELARADERVGEGIGAPRRARLEELLRLVGAG